MSHGSAIDYDALASQHGGTAFVDYDALAAQHGGTARQPTAPPDPKTTWQFFKETMPGTHDILQSLGLTREQMIAQNKYAGEHPWETIAKVFGEASPAGVAGNTLKSMVMEGGRGIKGAFSSNPTEAAMAPVHALSALNPFAAPVVDAMSEQGLGTPQANATGVVGAGTLAAGEVLPRAVPAAVRGATKVAAPVTRAALKVANKALSPAAVGGAIASYGGPVGAAAGAGIMPELFPRWAAAAREGRIIPTPEWAEKSTPQMDLFRNTPKLGNAPSGTLSEMSAPPQTNPLAVTNPALPQGEIQAASTVPRVPSGESVLNDVLTSLDNKTLLKVAKSRGINVTAESQLKPGAANTKLIKKIISDFSTDELDDVRSQGTEIAMHKPVSGPATPESGAEAWRYKVLQTYFPDVAIPKEMAARAQATIAQRPGATPSYQPSRPTSLPSGRRVLAGRLSELGTQPNIEDLLQQSIRQARTARGK